MSPSPETTAAGGFPLGKARILTGKGEIPAGPWPRVQRRPGGESRRFPSKIPRFPLGIRRLVAGIARKVSLFDDLDVCCCRSMIYVLVPVDLVHEQ